MKASHENLDEYSPRILLGSNINYDVAVEGAGESLSALIIKLLPAPNNKVPALPSRAHYTLY